MRLHDARDNRVTKKRKPGRPPKPLPEPIPDTPENVARALLTTPPKRDDEWKYLRPAKPKD